MKEKEEKLQKLYVEFQILNQQIQQLEKQSTMLNNQLMELTVTSQSLEDIKKTKRRYRNFSAFKRWNICKSRA